MNKNIFTGVALSAVILLSSTTSTFALTTEQMKLDRDQSKVEQQESLLNAKRQVIERIAVRVEGRFARHQTRLQNWIDRASKHIAKRKEAGKDTANAEKALDTAKTSLASAVTAGQDAVAQLRALSPESWSQQKDDSKAARDAVKKAQVAYAQVVRDFKTVLVELKKIK